MKPRTLLSNLLVIIMMLLFKTTFAQYGIIHITDKQIETQYFSDGTFKTVSQNKSYGDLEGSPYFFDAWSPGEATLSNGITYKDLLLKYDETNGTLLFKYALTDTPLVFSFQPLAFKMVCPNTTASTDVRFLNGFDPVDEGTKTTFYQVLVDGKTKLVKREAKKIQASEGFHNEVSQRVIAKTTYYVSQNNKLVRVKTDKASVLKALKDQQEKIDMVITSRNLDMNKEDDLGYIVKYYNTL